MSESKELELFDLQKAKKQMKDVVPVKRIDIEYIVNILKNIALNFAQQKQFNINILVEDLGKQCMKMKKKARVLKDEVENLIDMLINELSIKYENKDFYKTQLTKIKTNRIIIKDLQKQIKISKGEKDFTTAEKLKKQLVIVRGESYENIILPIRDLVETHKIKELETKIEKVEIQKEKKKDLRKEQQQLMIDFINFLITYKSLDNILYN